MGLFPLFVELEGRRCLVLGGGAVAARKARSLVLAGGRVEVWSREYGAAVKAMADQGQVTLMDPGEDPRALAKGAFVVVCATGDAQLNRSIEQLCRSLRIFVNCATGDMTDPAQAGDFKDSATSFIFPSLMVRDSLSVGIGLFPPAPSFSAGVRERLEKQLPDWYGAFGRTLARYREHLRALEPEGAVRGRVMERLTDYGFEHQGRITDDIFYKILSEEKDI